jgi:hypothetical protein
MLKLDIYYRVGIGGGYGLEALEAPGEARYRVPPFTSQSCGCMSFQYRDALNTHKTRLQITRLPALCAGR